MIDKTAWGPLECRSRREGARGREGDGGEDLLEATGLRAWLGQRMRSLAGSGQG